MSKTFPILAWILMAACAQGPPRPVEIDPADVCAHCKMAISQKQYAAELVDDERVLKFDDIGCMREFARARGVIEKPAGASIFVADYDRRNWLEGDKAQFVESAEISSPMSSGLIALSDRQRAESYAARFHGRILSFKEMWK